MPCQRAPRTGPLHEDLGEGLPQRCWAPPVIPAGAQGGSCEEPLCVAEPQVGAGLSLGLTPCMRPSWLGLRTFHHSLFFNQHVRPNVEPCHRDDMEVTYHSLGTLRAIVTAINPSRYPCYHIQILKPWYIILQLSISPTSPMNCVLQLPYPGKSMNLTPAPAAARALLHYTTMLLRARESVLRGLY